MAKDWTHVRLQVETKEELQKMIDSATLAYETGKCDQWWEGEKLTVDEMVMSLIIERQARKRRQRQSKARRLNWWDEAVKEMRDAVEG